MRERTRQKNRPPVRRKLGAEKLHWVWIAGIVSAVLAAVSAFLPFYSGSVGALGVGVSKSISGGPLAIAPIVVAITVGLRKWVLSLIFSIIEVFIALGVFTIMDTYLPDISLDYGVAAGSLEIGIGAKLFALFSVALCGFVIFCFINRKSLVAPPKQP